MTAPVTQKTSFWKRQFSVPPAVLASSKQEFVRHGGSAPSSVYREPAQQYREASEAEALFQRAIVSLVLLYVCFFAAIVLAPPIRAAAAAEVEGIQSKARPPDQLRKALYAYWMASFVVWTLWLFLALYVLTGLLVGLGFATGVLS